MEHSEPLAGWRRDAARRWSIDAPNGFPRFHSRTVRSSQARPEDGVAGEHCGRPHGDLETLHRTRRRRRQCRRDDVGVNPTRKGHRFSSDSRDYQLLSALCFAGLNAKWKWSAGRTLNFEINELNID